LNFIDLFAGIGGFRIALENCGAKCVFSSENNSPCQIVYKRNFGELPTGDITKVQQEEIPEFDILTAGFPCQPFSLCGKKEGFECNTGGTLFFHIANILKHKKPDMFLLENVKGLITHRKGETLRTIQEVLAGLGYTIYSTVLNSYDFGVPQFRERWYCVGFNKNIYFEFPVGKKRGSKLEDIVNIGLKDERLNLCEEQLERIDYHFKHFKKTARVEHDNSRYRSNSKKGKYGIFSYLKPDNTLRFHTGDRAKSQMQDDYFVSLKSVAPTIIATRAPKIWDLRRHLSVDECKRLQGFPEDFSFDDVSINIAKKQLGNAVTVPVVQAIAENMLFYYNKKINFAASSDNYVLPDHFLNSGDSAADEIYKYLSK